MSTLQWRTEPIVLRIAKAIAAYIGFGSENPPPPFPEIVASSSLHEERQLSAAPGPKLRLVESTQTETQHPSHKWRRHPKLRAYESPIAAAERDGRHEAVRGLFAARAGAIDVAIQHFTLAAKCNDVDLTAVPGFWNLTRGQMQAAVDAYEAVGRYKDAAALDAHIATIFRPSLVGAGLQPIVPQRAHQKAAST